MRVLSRTLSETRNGRGSGRQALIGFFRVVALGLVWGASVASPHQVTAQTPAIDLSISLHGKPLTADERRPYESIIGYFADGVYEASNGAHKIGRVTIYTDARSSDKADILWTDRCHPAAHVSGRRAAGLHVLMCDRFGSVDFLADDRGAQGGGYALAHEWGHYFYSLYDEYEGDGSRDDIMTSPHLGDSPVSPSIMNNQWAARGGHYEWLNFSVAKNNTANTAQHRAYGASGWETLARPLSEDPKDGARAAIPPRLHHGDLTKVAPGADEDARIDLLGEARSDLRIEWVSSDVAVQIVIDRSGSMSREDKMENAKTAAKLLVDLAGEGHTAVGVIAFDDEVTVVQPLTVIDGSGARDRIRLKIDGISHRGRTALGDAARKALDDLAAFGAEDMTKVVYLLTDGQSNEGIDPREVLPSYRSAGVPLFTFGYGSDADGALLQKMADDTGGKYYFSPSGLTQLTQAFQDAAQLTFQSHGLSSGRRTLGAGQFVSVPVTVDPTLTSLSIVVVHDRVPGLATEFYASEPGGTVRHDLQCARSGSEDLCFLALGNAPSGTWTLHASATGASTEMRYRISGSPGDRLTYTAVVSSVTGSVVRYPEPMVLLGVLRRDLPITGAVVQGTVERPDGTQDTVRFRDDGVAPDALAHDGLYSAVVGYGQNGAHNITVAFNNSAGTAALTPLSYAPSIGPDGKMVPLPPPIPIRDPFERFARTQVTVVNVRPDDHGNTPRDATPLAASNADIPGKMDYQDDVDVFRIVVRDPGDLSVRVSNLALGMNPRLRLIAADRVTVLADADLAKGASGRGYLALVRAVSAGDTVYAEVSHRSGDAGGVYDFSAGAVIPGDSASAAPRRRAVGYGAVPGAVGRTDEKLALALWIGLLLLAAGAAVFWMVRGRPFRGGARGAGVSVRGDPRRTVRLRGGVLRIGRDPMCELCLSDSRVSRIHARIVRTEQGHVIEDLGSTNGTMVNGKVIARQILQSNDQIQVGDTVLVFWRR